MKPHKHQKKASLRRWFMFFAGCCGWFLGMIALAWLAIPWWVPKATDWLNRDGSLWSQLDFKITHVDAQQLHIGDIRFQKDNIEVVSQGLSINYTPKRIAKKQIDSILFDPVSITIDIGFPKTPNPNSDAHKEVIAASFLEEISTLIPTIPYQEILATDIHLKLKKDSQVLLDSSLTLHSMNADGVLNTQADLQISENSIHIGSHISLSDLNDRSAELSFHVWDPMDLLERINPIFPPETSAFLADSEVSIGPFYGSIDWMSQEQLIASQLILSHLALADQISIDTLLLEAETPGDLTLIQGNLTTDTILIPNMGSTSMEGSFNVFNPLSDNLSASFDFKLAPFMSTANDGTPSELSDAIEAQVQYADNQITVDIPILRSPLSPFTMRDLRAQITIPSDPEQGFNFSSELKLIPDIMSADFEIKSVDTTDSITLEIAGTTEKAIKGLESLQSQVDLKIPKHRFQANVKIKDQPDFELSGFTNGQLQAEQNGADAIWDTHLSFEKFQIAQGKTLNLMTDGLISMHAATSLLNDWEHFDFFRDIQDLVVTLALDAQGTFAQSKFQLEKLVLSTITPSSTHLSRMKRPFEISAELLKWDGYKVLQPAVFGEFSANSLQAHLESGVLDPSLCLVAELKANWVTGEQEGHASIQHTNPQERITLALNELLPEIPTTILSAVVSASLDFTANREALRAPFTASISNGKVTIPDSGVSITGIQLSDCKFEDLLTGKSAGSITLAISDIDYASSHLSDLQCTITSEPGYTITIQDLRFCFCDGSFKVIFKKPIEAPYDALSFRVEFEGVDIKQLTNLIPDFKEDLTGKMDGFLPFKIEKGQIAWGKGSAYLSKGTTGRLRYAENGLIASYIPEIVISKNLDIDINKALRDIMLTELTVEIQPSSQFDQPTVVVMSGHSNNSKIEIPIERIQLNIRAGDIPGLLNKSFNSKKWIETILFQNKI